MLLSRRKMLCGAVATAAGTAAAIVDLPQTFSIGSRRIVLPCIDGDREFVLIEGAHLGVRDAHAQWFPQYNWHSAAGYGAYYQSIAQMQMLRYQQMMAAWQQQQMQLAQQYAWFNSQRQATVGSALARYQDGWQVGQPQIRDRIQSLYGYAQQLVQDPSQIGRIVMYGLNKLGNSVEIGKALPAVGAAWNGFRNILNKTDEFLEKALLPQSSEIGAKIILPNGGGFEGAGFKTISGQVGVTDNPVVQSTTTGQQYRVAKVKPDDGSEPAWLVI